MPPFQQHSRINVQDLKAQMVKRVGPERASQYFNHFKGYISLRFNKTELDKLVVLTIGKENIGLHNEIIKAVLSNAIKSETFPRPSPAQDVSKPVKGFCNKQLLQYAVSNDTSRVTKSPRSVWENGNICADSPRKDGLGVFGNTSKGSTLSRLADGKNSLVDLHRPFQHIEGAAELSEADPTDGPVRLSKRPRTIVRPSSPDANMRKARIEHLSLSSAADLGHRDAYHQQWENGPVSGPFGTSFYANSLGSAPKLPFICLTGSFPPLKGAEEEFVYSNDLPSKERLQRHMEYIATVEGLEGVSEDCVEIVNQGIDSLLKRLIGACMDLVKSTSGMQTGGQADRQVDSNTASLSTSIKSSKQFYGSEAYSSGATRKEPMENEENLFPQSVSFLDFKVAMDLNPQQLGQDWPLQLEKIHLY